MATPAIDPIYVQEVLAPFGLRSALVLPDRSLSNVFDSPLVEAARVIRALYPACDYDHRPEAPEWDRNFPYLMCEEFRRGYACFKYAVAKVLQPRSIVEIGVGAGTGARAFLAAAPHATYHGIDDGSKDRGDNVRLIDYTQALMAERGYAHSFTIIDSMTLAAAPRADLFHVDGAHDYAHAFNDSKLAFASGSPWVLVDDSRDAIVSAAAHMALLTADAPYEWTHFEDTWTGSILFHRSVG